MNRTQFKAFIAQFFLPEGCQYIMAAYDFSKYAHRNQEREFAKESPEDEKRYFNHPKRLALAMIEAGVRDWQAICVALLHDSVEDTALFGNQKIDGYYKAIQDAAFRLTKAFNELIAEDVICLTIPIVDKNVAEFSSKTKCLKFYKAKLKHASVRAALAKLFDRLDNLGTIEVKAESTARLKIAETKEFYLPLFQSKFSDQYSKLQKIGVEQLSALSKLIDDKTYLLDSRKIVSD